MSPIQLILFTFGQVGMMSLARYFFQWIIKFSTLEVAGGTLFAASAVGGVLLAFRLFDGVTDPLAGALSDTWVNKGKNRSRILWFSLLFPGLGLVLCFLPGPEMSVGIRWVFLVSGMFLFFLGYTFYAIPYWSLIDDYSRGDSALRRRLSNLLGAGLLLATGIGFIISPLLVESFGYFGGACIFAVVATIGMLGPILADPRQRAEISQGQGSKEELSPVAAFVKTFRQPRFVGLIMLLGGSQMSLTIMTSAAPFIAEDLLGGSDSDVTLLLGPLLGAALPCFIFAPRISEKFGWEKVLVASSILLAVVYGLCSQIGVDFVGGPFMTASLLFLLGGPMIALLLALEGEAVTDCAREAGGTSVSMYFGVYNLVVKALNGVAIFLAGIFAGLSTGPAGTAAIRWMVLSAGICLLIGMGLYVLIVFIRMHQGD